MPRWRALLDRWPHTTLDASGPAVGLPEGQMGNSEVGHLNLGAGRPVLQDYPRIDAAIADGSFFTTPALVEAARRAAAPGRLHQRRAQWRRRGGAGLRLAGGRPAGRGAPRLVGRRLVVGLSEDRADALSRSRGRDALTGCPAGG